MKENQLIQPFGDKKVRTVWDAEQEKWYFSIVDVCGVLTDQPDNEHARNYWKVLKHRLLKEGNQTVTNCNQLKLCAEDGVVKSRVMPERNWRLRRGILLFQKIRPLTICHLLTEYRNCLKKNKQ